MIIKSHPIRCRHVTLNFLGENNLEYRLGIPHCQEPAGQRIKG